MSDYSWLHQKTKLKIQLLFRRFKLPRPPNNKCRVIRWTKYFRWRSPVNYKKMNHYCFICRKPGHFIKNYPQAKKLKESIHHFEEIANHAGIYLNKEVDLESVFSVEKESIDKTSSLYMYIKNQATSMLIISSWYLVIEKRTSTKLVKSLCWTR